MPASARSEPRYVRFVFPAAVAFALAIAFGPIARGQARRPDDTWTCGMLGRPDADHHFLADEDLRPPIIPVNGDDLLALVNRSPRWRLGASYAPTDLVDAHTLRPASAASCTDRQCLRREAAIALHTMMDAMRAEGEQPFIDSAFRSFGLQCGVFHMWAYAERHGFCSAIVASALPGHSQHQLGTAVDLFTRTWIHEGDRFREGFGCSSGGRWLAQHAWQYGFVLPYPLHPDYRDGGSECTPRPEAIGRVDPRTGYKYEPWHIRFIGVANAAQFHGAWLASGPGTAHEVTLEQWLRARAGIVEPIDPPVCEACACGACATFHDASSSAPSPCGANALILDPNGTPVPSASDPVLVDAAVARNGDEAVAVEAIVDVPAQTLTQPPIVNAASGVRYPRGTTSSNLTIVAGGVVHAYPPLDGAWRLAIGVEGVSGFDWHAALVDASRDGAPNGINARIPATTGRVRIDVPIEGIVRAARLRVALVRGNEIVGLRSLRVP